MLTCKPFLIVSKLLNDGFSEAESKKENLVELFVRQSCKSRGFSQSERKIVGWLPRNSSANYIWIVFSKKKNLYPG